MMEAKEEKSEVKKGIRALKVKRGDALTRQAYQDVAHIRRGIRTLKRKSRQLARTAKTQAAAAPAPAPTPAA